MTFNWIGLALASQARHLEAEYPDGDVSLEHLVDASGGPLAPARATVPDLVRELGAAGTPSGAVPVAVVDDQTQANPTARGRSGQVRAGVAGECHGFKLTAPVATLVTITRLEVSSLTAGPPDFQIWLSARGGFSPPSEPGQAFLPILPLTVAQPRALVYEITQPSPLDGGFGIPIPLDGGFDEHSALVLRGHAVEATSGEEMIVWAASANVDVRWIVEWTEEPLPVSRSLP